MSLVSPAWRPARASVRPRAATAGHRLAGLGRTVTAWTAPRPHVLRREPSYIEAARMAREMERL